ncbi:dihydrofolate reductase family protein [Calidifontibacter terrae]
MTSSDWLDGPRPEVVLTSTVSVDGRITLGRSQRLMEPAVGARWATMAVAGAFEHRQQELEADAVLEGSGSFVDVDAPIPEWPSPSPGGGSLHSDYLPAEAPRWFVVADSRGRVSWAFTGDDDMRLLVLVCEKTPPGYLARLRELRIAYLVAGLDRVDLRIGLVKLAHDLGVRRVVADSGGTLNASLFSAGLVDLVDVVTLPGLVGGAETPTMFDGPERPAPEAPIRLELVDVAAQAGAVRTRYRVLR